MTKSPNESPKAIALKNKLGYPLINSSGEHYLPTAIRVGATIKFATIRNDGTIVTSTRFVTGGSNTHLALKDYTGKADGALNVTQTSRECPGDVHFEQLEYINSRDVNFGEAYSIEVINP